MLEKEEFLFYRNHKLTLAKPEGFVAQKVFGEDIIELDLRSIDLNDGERLVLSNGTTQIIVNYTDTPPSLKTNRYFNIEERLVKSVASSWAFALLLLGLVVAFPPEQEKVVEDKVVIIYKRKVIEKESEKPVPKIEEVVEVDLDITPVEEMAAEAAPMDLQNSDIAVKDEKIPEIKIQKTKEKKNTVARVDRKKMRKSKAALKKVPVQSPNKKFKFNFGSKMNTMISDTANTKLKKIEVKKSLNIARNMKSSSKVTSEYDKKKFGVTNSKVSRFAASTSSARKAVLGTKGLSGKKKTSTAYIEETTKILGAMDPEVIRVVMREYIPQFRHCYQRELITNPSVAGIFDVNFQINKQGSGVNIGVKSKGEAFSGKGKTCLKRVVSLIKFPKPKGGGLVDVRQPMNFYKQ